jgi:hypothetical protein
VRFKFSLAVIAPAIAVFSFLSVGQAIDKPEDELAGIVKIFFEKNFSTDWDGIEKFPHVQWAPLPPTMLQNCLPDGGCFARQGKAVIGGKNFIVMATGARTIVSNVYFRNVTAPVGEAAVVAALKQMALTAELARCPVTAGSAGTDWYRIKGAGSNPGVLSVQTSCNGKPCEGFVLTQSENLPPLQPNQLRLYTESCSATGADRKPVSTALPHEQLAQTIVALLAPAPALYDWKTLENISTGIQWNAGGAKKGNPYYKEDPNPWLDQGQADYSGRHFSVLVGGSPTEVKMISFEEGGMHPRGENLMGEIYKQGFAVKLVRCGPVYTESTHNWYSLTSAKTRPAMVQQSIRYEGNLVQDSYELRLDGTLPKRDPRDRDPGVGGCQ